jgi:hypothetical protein
MPGDSTGVVRRETLAWFDQWLGRILLHVIS